MGSLPNLRDLTFPAAPEPFRRANANVMFKPDGPGPFPALVILPTCAGHAGWYAPFDWAQAALDRGYAVMVVDPLAPRGVGVENCQSSPGNPAKVSWPRYRKDAFDAANHLRKQSFVDRSRVGLMGFSLGAIAALGASGDPFARQDGRPPFRGIVSLYPRCARLDITSGGPRQIRWVPHVVSIPLQVQMGDQDTETPAKDCIPVLQEQKNNRAPIEFFVHKNATHAWDTAALGDTTFSKIDYRGKKVEYRYNAVVTAESMRRAFDFFDRHVKGN
jgi:dienelactone hydrolase